MMTFNTTASSTRMFCGWSAVAFACAFLAASAGVAGEADKLREAEAIATEQDAKSAIGAYKELIQGGVDGAEVRYNLGTLYLENDEPARAIFHLKTALLFDPLHADSEHNFDVAVALRTDAVNGVETSTQVDLSLGRKIPRGLTAIAAGLFAFLFGLLFGLRSLNPTLRRSRAVLAGAIGAGVVALTFVAALGVSLAARRNVEAVVMADKTTARLGPSDDAKESFEAHAGLVGTALEERNGYMRMRLSNGLEAWVHSGALARVDGSPRLP